MENLAAGNFFLETVKIDCLARTPVDAKENNTSNRREGINHESRFNFSRRDRRSEDFARIHEASCIVCHRGNDKRENFGEIYRRDGKWAKARRKDLDAGTQEREARKFNGKAGVISKLLHTPCTRNRVLLSNFIMDFLETIFLRDFPELIERHFLQRANLKNSLNVFLK